MSPTAGVSIAAVFGFVSGVLSYGLLVVPEDLAAFRILAAADAIAFLPIGRIAADKVTNPRDRILLIVLALIVCVSCFLYYMIVVQSGSLEVSGIVLLACSLILAFGSFTFLTTIAGIAISAKEKD
jgi:hypothetical protein